MAQIYSVSNGDYIRNENTYIRKTSLIKKPNSRAGDVGYAHALYTKTPSIQDA